MTNTPFRTGVWILRVMSIALIFWGLTMFVRRYRTPPAPAPAAVEAARPGQESPTAVLTTFISALNKNDFDTVRRITLPAVLPPVTDEKRARDWAETLHAQLGPLTEADIVAIDHSRDTGAEMAAITVRMKPGADGAARDGRVRVMKISGSWYFAER